jgi:hypothetical protein
VREGEASQQRLLFGGMLPGVPFSMSWFRRFVIELVLVFRDLLGGD